MVDELWIAFVAATAPILADDCREAIEARAAKPEIAVAERDGTDERA